MKINDEIVFKFCESIKTGRIIGMNGEDILVEIPSSQVLLINKDQVID